MSASIKINLIPKVLELEVNSALMQRPAESFTQTYSSNLYAKFSTLQLFLAPLADRAPDA